MNPSVFLLSNYFSKYISLIKGDQANATCTQCVRKCFWDQHSNMPYKYIITREEVKKTAAELLAKYEEAVKNKDGQTGALAGAEQILKNLSDEIQEICFDIENCN